MDVLLLSASYGAGHDQAAAAVSEALKEVWPGCRTDEVDYLRFLDPMFHRLTQSLYIWSVKYFPPGWGAFYHATSALAPRSVWQRHLNNFGLPGLRGLLRASQPRVVVCTYPLQVGVLSELRERGEKVPRLATVITDHTIHSQWIHPNVDLYCVSSPEVADGLRDRGVPAERVRVTGLPVRAAFRESHDRSAARARMGLRPDEPHVLIMGGAFGMLPAVPSACRALLRLPWNLRLTVVCGRDVALQRRLEGMAGASVRGGRMRVLGFVRDVDQLMASADLLVGKAGGITTSEALAMGLPLVLYRAIPGQETANAAYLCRHGAALKASDSISLRRIVGPLLADREKLASLARAGQALARPDAALAIAREVRTLCA